MRKILMALGAALIFAGPGVASGQTPRPIDLATERAVLTCTAIAAARGEQGATAAIARREGLTASPTIHPMLQQTFYPHAKRVDWWGVAAAPGKLLVAVEPGEARCKVFLIGVSGEPVIGFVLGRLQGWQSYQPPEPTRKLMYRSLNASEVEVVDVSRGGEIRGPQSIGAVFTSKIVQK
ncbi:MAG: hypothetical protein GC145_18955 [Caulobacter sp.]|nr:hypothetical protein [Caulobacter sp.]